MMKRLFILGSVAIIALTACNKEQLEQQAKQIDSLNNVIAVNDSNMALLATALNGVQENLNYIKEKEGIISVSGTESNKEQLTEDINAIYARLVDNKRMVKDLQAKLNKAMGQNKEYQKIIEVLNKQIEEQNQAIEDLKKKLEEKDVEIAFLNDAVIRSAAVADSIGTVLSGTQNQLDQTTEELNTCYYLIADKATLKAKGLLEGGLFSKKIMAGDVNNDDFIKVDKTQVETIPLKGRRFDVLTQHPTSSYSINEDKKVLTIKNKEKFWGSSRYLIIRARSVDED